MYFKSIGTLDTCWNSDQGIPQTILIDFEKIVKLNQICIMFQGGFVGHEGLIEVGLDSINALTHLCNIQNIDDSNDVQILFSASTISNSCLKLSTIDSNNTDVSQDIFCRYLKLTFTSSTDFYGRITVYKLDIYGTDYV